MPIRTPAANVDISQPQFPRRINQVIEPWAERTPNRTALVESTGTWTYGQLASAIADAKKWLASSGVRPGDRVMVVGENCRAFVALLLALSELDAWPVLVNARLSAHELDQIKQHCGARRVIYTTSVSPNALMLAKQSGALIGDTGSLGRLGVGSLNEATEPEPVESDGEYNVAALIYTSGTTGVPKGVMLTHANLLFVAAGSAKIRALTPEDRIYAILPMSHAVGLSVVLLGGLLSGATLYLAPRFDPPAMLAALARERLTIVLGAPETFALVVDYANAKGIKTTRFSALRIISSCGAPLDLRLKVAVEKFFGQPLHNGYGLTECSPTIAQTKIQEPRKDTSVGEIFPGVQVRLLGKENTPVADGEAGELWVRGPNLMRGYYRAPAETAAAIDAEGWFNTHDLALLEDGNLFIVGRTKDLIVHFGFNIYPAEVEAVFNAHPLVVRSAVLGLPGETTRGGQAVVAFVQSTPDAKLTATELANYAAQHLAPYKRPSQIIFLDDIPVTPTGKIMKDDLLRMATAGSHAR